MSTILFTHEACLDHITPDGHPECADRLRAINEYLHSSALSALIREQAPLADIKDAEYAHTRSYLNFLEKSAPVTGEVYLDQDTVMSPHSLTAALYAVGAAMACVDAVFTKRAHNAFAATRPPGHHAESNRAMGFCLLNHVAIAARYALDCYDCKRVAIVDWDVHHGNGTQEIFWSDQRVLYASTHEMPLFPGSGAQIECGEFNNIVNVPLDPESGSDDFRQAFSDKILPRIKQFEPDLIIISAGFDAHRRDLLGSIQLTQEDFSWATHCLIDIANTCSQGRLISILEGGYDFEGLGSSVSAHLQALLSTSSVTDKR